MKISLFKDCLEWMNRKDNVKCWSSWKNGSTNVQVNNHIVRKISNKFHHLPYNLNIFALFPVSELILLCYEPYLSHFLTFYHDIPIKHLTSLCLDLNNTNVKYICSFLTPINDFLSRLRNISVFSIKWKSNGQKVNVVTNLRKTLKKFIKLNPRIKSFGIYQIIDNNNFEFDSIKTQRSDDDAIISMIEDINEYSLIHLSINHFFSEESIEPLIKKIVKRFLNLKYLDLHQVFSYSNTYQPNIDINPISKLKNLIQLDISAYSFDQYQDQEFSTNLAARLDDFILILNEPESTNLKHIDLSGLPIQAMNNLYDYLCRNKNLESFKICSVEADAVFHLISEETKHINFIPHPDMKNSHISLEINKERPIFLKFLLSRCVPSTVLDKRLLIPLLSKLIKILKIYKFNQVITSSALCSIGRINKKSNNYNIPIAYFRQLIKSTMRISINSETQYTRLDQFSQIIEKVDIFEYFSDVLLVKLANYFLMYLKKTSKSTAAHDIKTLMSVTFRVLFGVNSRSAKRRFNKKSIKTFLKIAVKKRDQNQIDETLEYVIKCIWNISDDNPEICSKLVENDGINILIETYKRFIKHKQIERMVLAIINNISEVPCLRIFILQKNIVRTLLRCLQNILHENVFYICGIFSNILITWEKLPDIIFEYNTNLIKEKIIDFISKTKFTNMQKIIFYQSFSNFLELLNSKIYPCILWSLWTIKNCIYLHPEIYCKLITTDKIIMKTIIDLTEDDELLIKELSQEILKRTVSEFNFS